jgi:FixJ family two-component response regulator
MSDVTLVVSVVDDDNCVPQSLKPSIRDEGWQPETLASAQECLDYPRVRLPNCRVVDVSLPGLNGLDIQGLFANERTDPYRGRTA